MVSRDVQRSSCQQREANKWDRSGERSRVVSDSALPTVAGRSASGGKMLANVAKRLRRVWRGRDRVVEWAIACAATGTGASKRRRIEAFQAPVDALSDRVCDP